MSMTNTNFDAQSHPRSAYSGRFTETLHSAPESQLVSKPMRTAEVQEAIDELTGGREVLEREIRSGVFGYPELVDARKKIWDNAGGPDLPAMKLEGHIAAVNTQITADNVERILEVTHYRAASGRYTATGGEISVTPLDPRELLATDWLAEGRSEHVAKMWESGREIGPESELSDHAARLFAEDALQNHPQHLPLHFFPRLAEFANAPYTEASGTSPEKIDALHAELHRLREGQEYLPAHRSRRLDMLATFATHALPGQL